MTTRRLALLGPVLALGLLAPFAHAAEYSPVLTKKDLFLTCEGSTKEHFVHELSNGAQPTWSATAPASVTTGAGCGKVDDNVFGGADFRTPYQLGFGGTVTGNVDAVTVTLHSVNATQGRPSNAPLNLEVRMVVDGVSMFGMTEEEGAAGDVFQVPTSRLVTVTPTGAGSTGQVTKLQFTVTGLDLLLEKDAVDHDIAFDLRATGAGSLGAEGWLWGAAEAPSGITVTPDMPAAAKTKALARVKREESAS